MGDNHQKLLDQYILDYMRRNTPATAEIFAREANVTPETPDLNVDPEGFLAEWWSIFWPTYESRRANNPNETASNVTTPQTEIGGLPNLPQTEISSTMAIAPNMMRTPGLSDPTMMMPTPGLNPINFRASNVTATQTALIRQFITLRQTEIRLIREIATNMMPTPGYSVPTMRMPTHELNPISFRASNVMTPQTVLTREITSMRQTVIRSTMAIAPTMMPTPGDSAPTVMLGHELNPIGSSVNPVYVNDDSLPTASNSTPQTALIPEPPNPRQTEISSTMVTSPNVMPRSEVDRQDAVDARRRRKEIIAERRPQRRMISNPPAVDQLASIPTSLGNPSTSGNVAAEPISREPSFPHLELPEHSETASPDPTTPTAAPNESENL